MTYTPIPNYQRDIPLPISEGGTGSTTALSNNRIIISTADKIQESSAITTSRTLVSDSNGLPIAGVNTSAQLESMPFWTKYTVLHEALQTNGLTNNITLFSLAAKTMIHKIVMKQTTLFTGGTIATYTLSIGITGNLAKYIAAYDVKAAVGDTVFGVSSTSINSTLEAFASAVDIKLAAISTVGNLNASTQGAVDIYVQTSKLP